MFLFSKFQTKNVVNISNNTNPPLQKIDNQVSKGNLESPNFLKFPLGLKSKIFNPTFRKGGSSYENINF